jgi:hypothetical protein
MPTIREPDSSVVFPIKLMRYNKKRTALKSPELTNDEQTVEDNDTKTGLNQRARPREMDFRFDRSKGPDSKHGLQNDRQAHFRLPSPTL